MCAPCSEELTLEADEDDRRVEKNSHDCEMNVINSSRHPKLRKNGESVKYGNYQRYYGYRNVDAMLDYRLKCMDIDWFEDKDVLDIGCNSGLVTILIANLFCPKRIVGIDIDNTLIKTARRNIYVFLNPDKLKSFLDKLSLNTSQHPQNFPTNIFFIAGNFLPNSEEELNHTKPEYDTILALSITKWIHLNWGDEGIKNFFRKCFLSLHPGGVFILEPQSWKTYARRKNLTATIRKNYQKIEFRPEEFKKYLLEHIGFESFQVRRIEEARAPGEIDKRFTSLNVFI